MRKPIKDSTILITGGAGFIGSHLADRLIAEKAKNVIIIDNMFLGNEENISSARKNGAILYKDDAEIVSSLEYIFSRHTIDIVFNCATKALNYSFVNPKNAFDTNIHVILNLLELLKRKAFSTLCHFSTSEVFGTAVYEPMDENHPRNPTTTYAAGKAAADMALESYVRMFGLDAFIVRPFNNYGPRQNYQGYLAGIIPLTIHRIFSGQSPQIHGTGQQTRDFIYAEDTVDAIVTLYDKLEAGDNVNISSDGQISINDLITKICNLTSYKGNILHQSARPSDVLCHNASNKKIKSMINYQLTPFEIGLEKTVLWYYNQFRRTKS